MGAFIKDNYGCNNVRVFHREYLCSGNTRSTEAAVTVWRLSRSLWETSNWQAMNEQRLASHGHMWGRGSRENLPQHELSLSDSKGKPVGSFLVQLSSWSKVCSEPATAQEPVLDCIFGVFFFFFTMHRLCSGEAETASLRPLECREVQGRPFSSDAFWTLPIRAELIRLTCQFAGKGLTPKVPRDVREVEAKISYMLGRLCISVQRSLQTLARLATARALHLFFPRAFRGGKTPLVRWNRGHSARPCRFPLLSAPSVVHGMA